MYVLQTVSIEYSIGSSTRAGCQNTLLHCFRNYTGYASRSASSSGCVFWHITVCMAQYQLIWQTACSRHKMSSLVVVFVLSTTRRCWGRQLVGQLSLSHVSCGCSPDMEQSACTDQDRLFSDNIPAPNQGLSFPSVIRLTDVYHCPSSRWRAGLEHVFVFLIC